MKKTRYWLHLYRPSWGWYRGFKRRVWVDECGNQFVNMRGMTSVEWVIDRAEWYAFERDC